MAVFSTEQGYTWADGSSQTMSPPSSPLATITGGAVTMVGDRPISYARLYRTQPWVAAAAHLLQRQAARLPIHTFLPTGTGEEYDRERTRDHPLAVLLKRPADGRSPLDLKAEIMLGLAVQGNHLERIVRSAAGAVPTGLERIDWRTAKPILSVDGMRVLAWEITPLGGGPVELLAPEDVVHFRWPSPDGPLGVSPLQQLGTTVRSEDAAQRYQASSLANGALHGVIVQLEDEWARDVVLRETVRQELFHKHTGPDRAHATHVTGGIKSIETLPIQTAVEAELINQRKVNREEIAAVFGVPPVLIGDLSHATYSNVEQMHKMLYLTVLAPWLALIGSQLDAQLIQREVLWSFDGVWVEWNLDEVLKGDTKARMESYLTGRRAGAFTVNDIRRKENLKPFDDPKADEPILQVNNEAPLSQIGESDDAPAAKADEPVPAVA